MTPPCSALAAACLNVLTHATSNTPIRAESLGRVTVNRRVAGSNPAWGARHHPFGIRGGWLTAGRSVLFRDIPETGEIWRVEAARSVHGPVAESPTGAAQGTCSAGCALWLSVPDGEPT